MIPFSFKWSVKTNSSMMFDERQYLSHNYLFIGTTKETPPMASNHAKAELFKKTLNV